MPDVQQEPCPNCKYAFLGDKPLCPQCGWKRGEEVAGAKKELSPTALAMQKQQHGGHSV